jgi:hypothetical protein
MFVSHGMKGWNKSGLDSFNNYYKFWSFGINPGLFQQKRTGPKSIPSIKYHSSISKDIT